MISEPVIHTIFLFVVYATVFGPLFAWHICGPYIMGKKYIKPSHLYFIILKTIAIICFVSIVLYAEIRTGVVTKLLFDQQGQKAAIELFRASLDELGIAFIALCGALQYGFWSLRAQKKADRTGNLEYIGESQHYFNVAAICFVTVISIGIPLGFAYWRANLQWADVWFVISDVKRLW